MMSRIFRWAVVLVLLVILISGSVAFYTVFFGGKDLVIPPLREMSVLDAVDEAERVGLEVKIEQIESSIPAGTVLAQWPEPGAKVRRDRSIILKVSKGGSRKGVPDIRGLEVTQALAKIQESGFPAGDTVKIYDDSRPAGSVIAQSPAFPAMIGNEKKIDLLVSLGPAPRGGKIAVPDLAQRNEGEAKEMLLLGGLKAGGVEYVPTQNSPEGMVIGTRPKAGSLVKQGSLVVLQVATGRKAAETAKAGPQGTDSKAGETSGAVVVEEGSKPARQVGPAGPVQTVKAASRPSEGVSVQEGGQESPSGETPVPAGSPAGFGATGTAKIRYIVPPLTKPLSLKIEMVDARGTKILLGKDVKGGERISLDAPFVSEGVVTIFLGGEFVWQERYK